jgi:DNA polymerase III alpha subunit
MLGMYISSHPVKIHQKEFDMFDIKKISEIQGASKGSSLKIGAVVTNIFKKFSKDGAQQFFIVIEDGIDRFEVMLKEHEYEQYMPFIEKNQILIVKGEVKGSFNSRRNRFMATNIINLPKLLEKTYIRIEFRSSFTNMQINDFINKVFKNKNIEGMRVKLVLGNEFVSGEFAIPENLVIPMDMVDKIANIYEKDCQITWEKS